MSYELILATEELAAHLDDPNWLIVDCRYDLNQPDAMQRFYTQAHIPGAIYAHLDHDLATPVIPGQTGRHPLPPREEAARHFGQMGIGPHTQVIVYDDQGGSLAAGRLWWMLRWVGHAAVAVLEGGWQKWLAEDHPTRGGIETHPAQLLPLRPALERVVEIAELTRRLDDPAYVVIDVRSPERYAGEIEPIDRIPGHIPGAVSAPHQGNLERPAGLFRSPEELRARYQALLGDRSPEQAILYCGSGVTASFGMLSMRLAGLGGAALFPGSYSEWVADVTRPVKVGHTP